MHMQGDPRTMQENPSYDDVVDDVKAFLAERIEFAIGGRDRRGADLGRPRDRLRQDASSTTSSCCAGSASSASWGGRSCVGTSRKSFIGKITGREVDERLGGTIASCVLAQANGAAMLRVHDVAPVRDAVTVAAAILGTREWAAARPAPTRVRRVEANDNGPQSTRRGRASRPLDLHPPRRQRRRAGGRPAARVRRLVRRPRLRRRADRPPRGHGRLRRGVRHRRARGDRAQLPHARAPRPGRRRAADGALRLRERARARRRSPSRRCRSPSRRSPSRSCASVRSIPRPRRNDRRRRGAGSATSAWARTSATARRISAPPSRR